MPEIPTDIEQYEVLWIGPDLWQRAHQPKGFPLRVDSFLGRHPDGRIWIRGAVLDTEDGHDTGETVLVLVPPHQPRAVRRGEPPPVNPVRPYVMMVRRSA